MILEIDELKLLELFKNQYLDKEIQKDGDILFSVDGKYAGKARSNGAQQELLFEQIILPEFRWEITREDLYETRNDLGIYLANFEEYIEDEIQKQQKRIKMKKRKRRDFILQASTLTNDEHVHTKAQYILKQLGEACNVSVWIATNDKNKRYEDEKLEEEIEKLPNYPIANEIKKRTELIDTIWFDEQQVLCAFEVECSTSVYSGLLRMCDLMISMPQMPIQMYIVAPMQREEKVMREIRRPTFEHMGLSSRVKFIPLELLEPLLTRVAGLEGCLRIEMIDRIAITP